MAESLRFMLEHRAPDATVRVCWVAERQWGVISRRQLLDCGLTGARIARWVAGGRLHRLFPSTYAVGHRSLSIEGRLVAALLYAGPGAELSRDVAVWWWRLIDQEPRVLHVNAPGRKSSLPDLIIHRPGHLDPIRHRGMPVTSVAQTLLDFAITASPDRLRRALAEADYLGLVDVAAIEPLLGRGRCGSAELRAALERHLPQIAYTRSELEVNFLALCEAHVSPIPETNVMLDGWLVDSLWREQRVVVELDGHQGHRTRAQLERDHERDLALRGTNHQVRRYSWRQVMLTAALVAQDLEQALGLNPTATSA